MADAEQVTSQTPAGKQKNPKHVTFAEQVTSQTPATKQKNPKRVAAGKTVAEKTRQAREAQKKALAEAQIILANERQKRLPVPDPPAPDPPASDPLAPDPPASDPPAPDPPADAASKITTTQWPSVISIIVSLVGLYYKRKEIKGVFANARAAPPLPRAPPPSPATQKRAIREMD